MVPTCTDSASPGLATLKAAGPNEPKQSPTCVVSGYPLRLSVLPNAAIPTRPARGPQHIAVYLDRVATYWIFRSGLSCDRLFETCKLGREQRQMGGNGSRDQDSARQTCANFDSGKLRILDTVQECH